MASDMRKTRTLIVLACVCLFACSRAQSNDSVAAPAAQPTALPGSPPIQPPAAASEAPVMPGSPATPPSDPQFAKPITPRRAAPQPEPPPPPPTAGPHAVTPAGGGGGAFDGSAAARALATVDLTGCGAPPGASGHVSVTFSPDGSAKSEIDSGSFGAASTCIRQRYDALRIPSFDGTPVKTGKSFLIPGS
jgi:hypothetical protein